MDENLAGFRVVVDHDRFMGFDDAIYIEFILLEQRSSKTATLVKSFRAVRLVACDNFCFV